MLKYRKLWTRRKRIIWFHFRRLSLEQRLELRSLQCHDAAFCQRDTTESLARLVGLLRASHLDALAVKGTGDFVFALHVVSGVRDHIGLDSLHLGRVLVNLVEDLSLAKCIDERVEELLLPFAQVHDLFAAVFANDEQIVLVERLPGLRLLVRHDDAVGASAKGNLPGTFQLFEVPARIGRAGYPLSECDI